MTNSKRVEWCLSKISETSAKIDVAQNPLYQLTVIVPSYCRQDFLLRQLAYWHGSPVELYLLDGSPDPLDDAVVQALAPMKARHYIHNPAGFGERVAGVVPLLSRPYVVLLGDDEFHLPTGLARAVQMLQGSPDFVGCIGQSLRFYIDRDSNAVMYGRGYKHFKYEAAQSDVRMRFVHAMENYNAATCYAVLRRETWQRSWGELLSVSCKDVLEVQQALETYADGKFTTVDEIYWMRSDENASILDDNNFKRLNFSEWWSGKSYVAERNLLLSHLAGRVAEKAEVSKAVAEDAVIAGIDAFTRFYVENNRPSPMLSLSVLKSVLARVLRWLLPNSVYGRVRASLAPNIAPHALADLGSMKDLHLPQHASLFHFDQETEAELVKMEQLINEFYL